MCQENHFRYPLDSNLCGAQENRGGRGTVGKRKEREMGVLKGWEVGETGANLRNKA